jgi:hypothetical protein
MSDLTRFAATLGDPSLFFLRDDALVVRHDTGVPEYRIEGETLVPFSGWSVGTQVSNPPGFAGFPAHDPAHPDHDLARHGLDPSEHFVHLEAERPLVVRHRDGVPTHRIEAGQLVAL